MNNRKGLVFFVSHFRQPAPSERTRQSGTGRTSPVREILLENAQMRLAKGWQCGCARVPLAFRKSVTVSMFSTMGMRESELGSRTLQDVVDLELLLRLSSYYVYPLTQSVYLPSSDLLSSISISYTTRLLLYLYLKEKERKKERVRERERSNFI